MGDLRRDWAISGILRLYAGHAVNHTLGAYPAFWVDDERVLGPCF